MTDHEALLAAILASPQDDLPRLIYADWLEEQGNEARAEFIRVQCAIAQRPTEELRQQERELLTAHRAAWGLPIKGLQDFQRGFVESIATSAERFLAAQDALLEVPLRHVRLVAADHFMDRLNQLPIWERVESVDFANNHLGIHNRLRNFLTLNKLPQLTTLGLYNNRLWAETIQQFTYISRFRQLTALNLSGNPIGEPGFAALTTSQQFSQLRQLQIHSDELAIENCLHARSGEQLAASNVLTQLELLDLAGHYLGDAGVKSIVESPVSQNLRSLDVSDNELGEYGTFLCEAIAKSPYLKNLRYLGLRRSQITSDSLQILLQLPQLAKGMHLDLEEIDLSTALQNQIRESPYAEQVSWTID